MLYICKYYEEDLPDGENKLMGRQNVEQLGDRNHQSIECNQEDLRIEDSGNE